MINGKSKPIRKGGFRTKAEAKGEADEIEELLRKGIKVVLIPQPFDTYFEEWVNIFKPNIGKNTKERYNNTLNTIKEYFPGRAMQEIKKKEYQLFLNEYGKTRSKESVRKLNSHIRACVKEAMDEGIVRVDFTRNAELTGLPSKKASEKHLNYQDSKVLLKKVNSIIQENLNNKISLSHYVILLGLTSGMRFGEMVGLTRNDFDFQNNTININKTWGYTNKMHKGFGPTKTEQSERIIKMDERTMNVFEKFISNTEENDYELVFYNPHSKYKVISNGAVNKVIKNLLTQNKIDSISVHGLRHTHASILIYKKKVTINYISERLGHKDIETTIRDYSHVLKELREEDQAEATEIMIDLYD